MLPSFTAPFLLHGGHDHLRFTQPLANGQGMHVPSGYWTNGLAVVGINLSPNGSVIQRARQIQLTRTSLDRRTRSIVNFAILAAMASPMNCASISAGR